MDKILLYLYLLVKLNAVSGLIDPCDPSNHRELHQPGYRGTSCDSLDKNICDHYIGTGWFTVRNFDEVNHREIVTHSIPNFKCGAQYPIWMNGTHPTQRDGIVDRVACMAGVRTICDRQYPIKVKNCQTFYVYHLSETIGCSEAYCFGDGMPCKELDPCDSDNRAELSDIGTRTTSCKDEGYKLCDDELKENWYRTKGDVKMPTTCVEPLSCGTEYPLWLNGSYPRVQDIVVDRKVCVSGSRSCCDRSYLIRIRNCSTFMVYRLKKTTHCPERYCFGTSEAAECDPMDGHGANNGIESSPCDLKCMLLIVLLISTLIIFPLVAFGIYSYCKSGKVNGPNKVENVKMTTPHSDKGNFEQNKGLKIPFN